MKDVENWKSANGALFQLAEQINQRHTGIVSNTRRLVSEAAEIGYCGKGKSTKRYKDRPLSEF